MDSPIKGALPALLVTNAAAGLIAGHDYAARLAVAEGEIKTYDDGRPYRINTLGQVEILEKLQASPTFRRGKVDLHSALDFAKFVKRFRSVDTVIFADALADTPVFTAAFDYHPAGAAQKVASWDLFRAVLPLTTTDSWSRWIEADGVEMEQEAFALFLEENVPDIAAPDGAKLVEIARALEAAVGVNWQSAIRADNGERQFSYIETINGSASTASGKVSIPTEFTLALAPFEGSKRYGVTARLRYRINSGRVKLWFVLVRTDDVLREAFDDELLKIDTELNGATSQAEAERLPGSILTPIYKGPAPDPLTPPSVKD